MITGRRHTIARRRLHALADGPRGRRLLQLALRGIETSGRGVTVGCWVAPGGGVSGCVFQHAYWQGVAEGTFRVADQPSREIRGHVADEDFPLVMEAIRALDSLGKREFMPRRGLHRALDEPAWRAAVQGLLVDALATGAPAAAQRTPAPA